MGEPTLTFRFLGMPFSAPGVISGTLTCIIVFALVFALSRHLTLKPTGGQNVLEWLIEFTNGIVKGTITGNEASRFNLYAFTLFLFIFVANQLGLIVQVAVGKYTYVNSPTSDPVTTITFALITIMMAHFSGIAKNGFKGYVTGYLKPFSLFLPVNIFEEFTNFLTLGLRLFGNIFSGELLLKMLGTLGTTHGVLGFLGALPVEIIWQGFSVFIGSVQAYVFVTLTSVYISQKLNPEE